MIFSHAYWSKEGKKRIQEASLLPPGEKFLSV
jgi:hypothetical protein